MPEIQLTDDQIAAWKAMDDAFQRMLEAKERLTQIEKLKNEFKLAREVYREAHKKYLLLLGKEETE